MIEIKGLQESDVSALQEHLRQGGTVDEFMERIPELDIFPTLEFTDRQDREVAALCLFAFLGDVVSKDARLKQHKEKIETAGISALLRFVSDSVARDDYLDEAIRDLLLSFLDDELPLTLSVRRRAGRPPTMPETAILAAMKQEWAVSQNLESAYAAAKQKTGASRSRAQQVAKKHGLGRATKPA
jgi:hypothetical protein